MIKFAKKNCLIIRMIFFYGMTFKTQPQHHPHPQPQPNSCVEQVLIVMLAFQSLIDFSVF